jgi:hypothetical protein
MEEVEMLADKVVVMAHGQIQVRFGAFGKWPNGKMRLCFSSFSKKHIVEHFWTELLEVFILRRILSLSEPIADWYTAGNIVAPFFIQK